MQITSSLLMPSPCHRYTQYSVSASFIEIYNETVIDLLSHNVRNLTLREDALHDRIFVEGANEVPPLTFGF